MAIFSICVCDLLCCLLCVLGFGSQMLFDKEAELKLLPKTNNGPLNS